METRYLVSYQIQSYLRERNSRSDRPHNPANASIEGSEIMAAEPGVKTRLLKVPVARQRLSQFLIIHHDK